MSSTPKFRRESSVSSDLRAPPHSIEFPMPAAGIRFDTGGSLARFGLRRFGDEPWEIMNTSAPKGWFAVTAPDVHAPRAWIGRFLLERGAVRICGA